MKKLKVVVIGAGSSNFGRGIIADFLASEELKELNLAIALVDIDKVALDRMYRFANLLKEYYGVEAEIKATVNREEVLPGANYVITSIARSRWQLWEKDFYIPAAYGFRHVFGETGGPGAAFHTLRSLHLMVPIAKDMEKLCPDAFLINFTNPESRVCLGTTKLTNIRTVGLCHGAFSTLEAAARILGKPPEDIDLTIGGINHFHWVVQIRDRSNEKDLYPKFHQKMEQSDWDLDPLTREMYKVFGLFPFPASSHIGEYVSFAHEICGPTWLNWHIGKVSRLLEDKPSYEVFPIELMDKPELVTKDNPLSYEISSKGGTDKIQRIVEGKEPLIEKLASPTEELAVPIISDIEFNRNKKELSVNVPNENLAISNMPEDAIIEVSAQVDAQGIHPVKIGALPEAIAAMCNKQISIQKLVVEAYRERSKKLLLQALAIDPVVNNINRAEQMMEKLLEIEANFLPAFH